MTLNFSFRAPRQIAAVVVVFTLVAVTAALAIGITNPEPVSSGLLGPDWQCTRLAFVFTTCSRVARFETASVAGKAPACARSWRNALGLLR
ncbi:MAG: hypothetical protein U1E61_18440 [Bradyrhizobium sp.]